GDEHKQQRRIVMEPFSKKMIAGYHDTVAAMTQLMIDRWQPGEVRDINEEMTQYMLRLTSSILFGLDHEELAYKVGRLTERWVALNHEIGPAAFNPDAECAAAYDELLSVAEELEDAVQEMLRLRRSGELGRDVLSLLIRAHENGEWIGDQRHGRARIHLAAVGGRASQRRPRTDVGVVSACGAPAGDARVARGTGRQHRPCPPAGATRTMAGAGPRTQGEHAGATGLVVF